MDGTKLAAAFLFSNLAFVRRLRRARVPLEGVDCPLPVYLAENLPSPCLFGLLRPADLLRCATTMTGGQKSVFDRVARIAHAPRARRGRLPNPRRANPTGAVFLLAKFGLSGTLCWSQHKKEVCDMEKRQEIQVITDPEVAGIDFSVRRPYFRMRGKPVTEEQAFDIIRRTDNFFHWDMDEYHLEDLVGDRFLLDNVWYSPNFFPHPRGWVRPDGFIGQNDITGKYPCEEDFLDSILPLKEAFPYLDLMIGVTDWNETPPYVWDKLEEEGDSFEIALSREDYPDFPEHIVYGIWLHDDKVELMAPARAREKYLEYNRLYGGADESIFASDYYEDHNIHPADFDYLRRCIRSHGLDPDEVLAPYEWTSRGLERTRGETGNH